MKRPFVTLEQLQEIVKQYPTPFHLYDEKGIRETARGLYRAFSWNPGFKEYFAVKATPNTQILKLLREEGCGVDCSSLTELMMSQRCGFAGDEIMFSSNDTPAEEFQLAAELGATINLDDISHIDFLRNTIGYIPKKISCRYNPGGTFTLGESKEGFQVMDNPGEAKYGLTRPQMTQAFRRLKELGAEEFGIHAFLASNTISNEYYPALAAILFRYAGGQADADQLGSYADGAGVSAWAREAMNWAVAQGLITGKSGGRLDPGGTASRAEVSAILMRYVQSAQA